MPLSHAQVVVWSCPLGDMCPGSVGGVPLDSRSYVANWRCTLCMCYSLFVVCACVCVHCTCVRCERCPSLPPPQQAAHPTTMCVKRRSEGPLPVGASCHSLWTAILSCEWCSACYHSSLHLSMHSCAVCLSAIGTV